jgi:hypothetical protein
MGSMGQFIAHYRYLLLACLALAVGIAAECLLIGPPAAPGPVPSQVFRPLPLRAKYRQVQERMPRQQVARILGHPDNVFNPGHDMLILWMWQEGRDTVGVFFGPWDDNPVLSKTLLQDSVEIDRRGMGKSWSGAYPP